jgi:D-lyxose ketol-isomerase
MKRSEINRIMREGIAFMEERRFLLPPFASWTPDAWRTKGPESAEIVERQLGWDITDFGGGDFDRAGLFLFTIRNGALNEPNGKTYAEKIMIVRAGQVTPTHLHYQKMEDIINRGGGDLVIQLWNSIDAERLADTDVTVSMDGVKVTVPAGGTVTLRPGESVTLPQFLWHKFWGDPDKGDVLVGEVSRVNDDNTDNLFYDGVGRFPEIEEDEEPLSLLTKDYARYYSA